MDRYSRKVANFYNRHVQIYGSNDYRSVVWSTKESQVIRFRILAEVANLANKSVLDVGSGLTDLYAILKPLHVIYTGIDLSEKMQQESIKKYPEIDCVYGDFLTYNFDKQFDYVLCSGAFNVRAENHMDYLKQAIHKMYVTCEKGVACFK